MTFSEMYLSRNNKCPQVFTLDIGWVHVYLLKTKAKAHNAFSLMILHEGVLPYMTMDGSKEKTLGWFC